MSNTAGKKLWKSFQDLPTLMMTQSQITKTSWNGKSTLLFNLFAERKFIKCKTFEKHLYRLKKFCSGQTFVLHLIRIPALSSNTFPSLPKISPTFILKSVLFIFFHFPFFFPPEIPATYGNQTRKVLNLRKWMFLNAKISLCLCN